MTCLQFVGRPPLEEQLSDICILPAAVYFGMVSKKKKKKALLSTLIPYNENHHWKIPPFTQLRPLRNEVVLIPP